MDSDKILACETFVVAKKTAMKHGKRLKLVDSTKHLGVTLTKHLSWKNHIGIITTKANNT